MPTIRTYQPQVNPGVGVDMPRSTPATFGAGVADAIGGIEDVLVQRRREDAATSAALRLAENGAVTAEGVQLARTRAPTDGAGHADAVVADFDKRTASILEGITDKQVRNRAQVQLIEQRSQLLVQERGFEAGKRVDKMAADVGKSVDFSRATLFTAPTDANLQSALQIQEDMIGALSVADDVKDKLRTDAREKIGLAFGQGLAERDPRALRDRIERGDFTGMIDPDKLAALHNRADTEIKGIEAAQRQADAERRREARDAERDRRQAVQDFRAQVGDNVRALNDRLRDGGIVTAAEIGQATTLAARAGIPELARTTASLGIKALTVQGLRGQPPVAVQGYINDLSARIRKAGPNASTDDMIAREAASDYLNTAKRELGSDPLSFAAREGVVAVPPLDPTNPASFTARLTAARAVSRRYGVPLAVMTDEEAGAMQGQLNGTPQQAAAAVTSLRAFGRDGAYAAARQLAPKDPTAAHMVALSLVPGAGGVRNVADIQTGRELLKANPKIVDNRRAATAIADTGLAMALRARPQLATVIPEIAGAIYAARWTAKGNTDFDQDAYKGAVNAALGAYRDSTGTMRGGVGSWGGMPTLLPTGVSQDEFDAARDGLNDARLTAVKGGAPVDARGKPVPAGTIRGGTLLPIGDGRYKVEIDGAPVLRSGGGHFVLSIGAKAVVP